MTQENQNILFLIFLCLFCIQLTSKGQNIDVTKQDSTVHYVKKTVTAPIVAKPFIKKNGEPTDFYEYYIVQSVDDYYIKFCESNISYKELEQVLKEINSDIKTLTMEIEIRTGYWDICEEVLMQQSRVGDYVIIHKIIE